tara:strand:- start:9865 stop:10071 length:207 start_codon:yes stop_codon:yes gene_type:complete
MIKLFGHKNRTLCVRHAPKEESGKYNIVELALIDHEFDAVGSIGVAYRSDEIVNPVKQADRETDTAMG